MHGRQSRHGSLPPKPQSSFPPPRGGGIEGGGVEASASIASVETSTPPPHPLPSRGRGLVRSTDTNLATDHYCRSHSRPSLPLEGRDRGWGSSFGAQPFDHHPNPSRQGGGAKRCMGTNLATDHYHRSHSRPPPQSLHLLPTPSPALTLPPSSGTQAALQRPVAGVTAGRVEVALRPGLRGRGMRAWGYGTMLGS